MTYPTNKVADLQYWLTRKGAKIKVDGIGGPKTRQAILDVFRNTKAERISHTERLRLAARTGASLRQISAVSAVEAPRGGWDRTGLLTCLYERHYGWRRWQLKIPFLSNPKPGGYTIDIDRDGINDSWEKVADAACRFGAEAFECASWGKFQIMGAWWEKLGYASVLDFVYELSRSEYAHYEAFVRYLEKFHLVQAFRAVSGDPEDNIPLARGYNGPAFRRYGYHIKIAAEMRK